MEDQVLQIVSYLVAIVVLILGCGLVLKKINRNALSSGGPIQVKAMLSLGVKEKVMLIQVGERQQILLGVTPGRITRIESFSEPIVLDEAEGFGSFKEKLQLIMRNGGRG